MGRVPGLRTQSQAIPPIYIQENEPNVDLLPHGFRNPEFCTASRRASASATSGAALLYQCCAVIRSDSVLDITTGQEL